MANGKQVVGGTVYLTVDGVLYTGKGEFTYGLGVPKREPVETDGFKETEMNAYIEGAITDRAAIDLKALFTMQDGNVTLETRTGRRITLIDAYYTGDGEVKTDEGEIGLRFESTKEAEVNP